MGKVGEVVEEEEVRWRMRMRRGGGWGGDEEQLLWGL